MSYSTKRLLHFAFKGLFWFCLVAIIVYIALSTLFYLIANYQFNDLQNKVFSHPILFAIPVLLFVGLAGARFFKPHEDDDMHLYKSRRKPKNYRPVYALVLCTLLVAFALYNFAFTKSGNGRFLSAGDSKRAAKARSAKVNPQETVEVTIPTTPEPMAKKEVKKDSVIVPPLKEAITVEHPAADESNNYVEGTSSELKYKIISKAYLYNAPDKNTRRNAYINSNNSYNTLLPKGEKNGFVYVVFTNETGNTVMGWLNKKDLIPVNEIVYNSSK